MLGAGLNLQQAHTAVYLGIDYKFEDFIQSVHRLHRFQQAHPVHIHIIHTDTEDHVVEVLQQKWQRHDDLTETMRGIVRKYGFSQEAMMGDLGRKIGVQREEVAGSSFGPSSTTRRRRFPAWRATVWADSHVDSLRQSL